MIQSRNDNGAMRSYDRCMIAQLSIESKFLKCAGNTKNEVKIYVKF